MLKEMILGVCLLVGGLILALSVLMKPDESPTMVVGTTSETINNKAGVISPNDTPIETPVVQEIGANDDAGTVDLETETKVLEDKYKDRQLTLEQKTAEANVLKAQQEQAKKNALERSELEASQQQEQPEPLEVQTRPESKVLTELERVKAEKEKIAKEKAIAEARLKALEAQTKANKGQPNAAQVSKVESKKPVQVESKKSEPAKDVVVPKTYVVQSGDSLIRLSRQYGIPVSAIAELNGMGRNDSLHRGRTIKLPSPKDVKYLETRALEREKQEAEKRAQEQKRQDINDRLTEARREAKRQGINEGYVVQVALATNQAKADELAKQYKKAGYPVRTLKEARGVRVIVGSERSKEAAIILKQKINNDPAVSANGAWVVKQ